MGINNESKTIQTDRLLLRMFQASDAEIVTRLCNNYNIFRNTLYLPYPYSLTHALTWIETHEESHATDKMYTFAITDRITGALYGAIGLSNHVQFKNGEIAYWIGEEFWGKGYATEAAKAMLSFAFEEKDYHKVFARHFGSNKASGKVIEKIGMVKEGVFKDHIIKEGTYEDMIYYGIIVS